MSVFNHWLLKFLTIASIPLKRDNILRTDMLSQFSGGYMIPYHFNRVDYSLVIVIKLTNAS